jgi:hypothetical protein
VVRRDVLSVIGIDYRDAHRLVSRGSFRRRAGMAETGQRHGQREDHQDPRTERPALGPDAE